MDGAMDVGKSILIYHQMHSSPIVLENVPDVVRILA
jgi:hypothetical protein